MVLHPSGDLKENDPKENGTIMRCGLVGVDMVLLAETCHRGVRF